MTDRYFQKSECDGIALVARGGFVALVAMSTVVTAKNPLATSGLGGSPSWEIKTVEHFDSAVELVREEDISSIVCGPDVDCYLENINMENINKFVEAGFDHVWLHQVARKQGAFLEFWERELLPRAS